MRNGNKHIERNGYKTNEVRVGLSEIKELSKSSVKATRAITLSVLCNPGRLSRTSGSCSSSVTYQEGGKSLHTEAATSTRARCSATMGSSCACLNELVTLGFITCIVSPMLASLRGCLVSSLERYSARCLS